MVYLRLYSTLTKYLKDAKAGEDVPAQIDAGSTVAVLIASLGIAQGEVFLISVNGEVVEPGYILREGDTVSLFGPVAGGAEELGLAVSGAATHTDQTKTTEEGS